MKNTKLLISHLMALASGVITFHSWQSLYDGDFSRGMGRLIIAAMLLLYSVLLDLKK